MAEAMDQQAEWIAVGDDAWRDALRRARGHAPFLRQALDRQPDLEALLRDGKTAEALDWAKEAGGQSGDAAVDLRKQRLALAMVLATGDLAGAFPVGMVMQRLQPLRIMRSTGRSQKRSCAGWTICRNWA